MKLIKYLIYSLCISSLGLIANCGSNEKTSTCGNAIVEVGEECDDGNDINDDTCSNTCTLVISELCGNGVVDDGEECDDGNDVPDDGCNINCSATLTPPFCGDGNIDDKQGEECDDGNDINDDTCSNTCTLVIEPVCGDGITAGKEECDDGNDVSDDGCENSCIRTPIHENKKVADLAQEIPDDAYNGNMTGMSCASLLIEEDPDGFNEVFEIKSVALGIKHSALGNLVVKLYSPSGDSLTLLNRPGFGETQDDGIEDGVGDDSDLDPSFLLIFSDVFDSPEFWDAESMGDPYGPNQLACNEEGHCKYFPSPGSSEGLAKLSDFIGTPANGDWQLCVGDAQAEETGALDYFSLSLSKKLSS